MNAESVSCPENYADVKELVTLVEGDPNERLKIFMQARQAFHAIIGNQADHIFDGLFEKPEAYEKNARCLLGRTREYMGKMTREKVKALIALGRIEGFGFMTRLLEDAVMGDDVNSNRIDALFPEKKMAPQNPCFVCGTEVVSGKL